MIYRDHQGLSSSTDPNQSSKIRDRYLDNCFLLCINRDENTDVPEIHRLENHLMKELCQKNQWKSQEQRLQTSKYNDDDDDDDDDENDEDEEEDLISPRQRKHREYFSRKKDNKIDRGNFQLKPNRSKYQREQEFENYSNHDQYSRISRRNYRNDYNNLLQKNDDDDDLSVYEIYVPTNTLNRLSDKRIDNNMVLIDYEDVSALQTMRGPPTYNIPRQYNDYPPINQYNEYGRPYPYDLSTGFSRERDDQQQYYQNNLLQQQQQQQQRFNGYYPNENDRLPYAPQSGPFLPPNVPFDRSNTINVRRHLYSPSQLPQGLTEGQLAMLLQKGSQYQPKKPEPTVPQTQLFPTTQASQLPTSSTMNISTTPLPMPSTQIEPFKNLEPTSVTQIKVPQVPPQIIDHQAVDDDQNSTVDEPTKPMTTINPRNSLKSSKEKEEKKKDKTTDSKKEKKSEKDDDEGGKKESKKDGKKEKSSGKDGKKKKK